jgi:hypothetical protein
MFFLVGMVLGIAALIHAIEQHIRVKPPHRHLFWLG